MRPGNAGFQPARTSADADPLTAATAALRNWIDSLDPGPALALAHRQARIRRRVRLALIVLGGFVAVVGLALLAKAAAALT